MNVIIGSIVFICFCVVVYKGFKQIGGSKGRCSGCSGCLPDTQCEYKDGPPQ